jgi:undecaprenyl-diphosphatase
MPTNALEWMAVWFLVGRREGVVGVSFMLSAWAVCRGIKALVRRERPHLALTDARLVGLAPSGSSFPSSHVALVLYTALAAPVALGWGPTPALAALLLAGAVAYARVYLGAHYPRDVLAGMVIGATCAGAAMIWL